MNKIPGTISNIQISGSMSIVSVKLNEHLTFKTIIIETPDTAEYLKEGNPINLLFKETEVIIGSDDEHQVSLQNQISGIISSISKSDLLSKVVLDTQIGTVTSIISTNAVNQLGLSIGSPAKAMVKLNEVMLSN